MADLRDHIAKYLKGELTAQERHALEKQALEDPFLADALDGAQSIEAELWEKDVNLIRDALSKRTQKRSGFIQWNWTLRIAAGLILLVVSTFIISTLMRDNHELNSPIALNQETDTAHTFQNKKSAERDVNVLDEATEKETLSGNEEPSASPPDETSPLKNRLSTQSKQPASISAKQREQGTPYTYHMEENEEINTIPSQEPEAILSNKSSGLVVEDAMTDKKVSEGLAESSNDIDDIVIPDQPAGFYNTKSKAERKKKVYETESSPIVRSFTMMDSLSSRTITGQVVDAEDGLPIPGVNIVTKSGTAGTTTDMDGNFQLTIPTETTSLSVSFTGLESQEITLPENLQVASNTPAPLRIKMEPDVSALQEIVVVGYAMEIEQHDGTKWELARPSGGKKAYENYLEKNLVYPEVAIENEVEGKVSVQFLVQPNGQISDLRVVKSLGYGCDEELVRLIREGPGWKPALRNEEPVPSKAKVKMKFTLPKKKR